MESKKRWSLKGLQLRFSTMLLVITRLSYMEWLHKQRSYSLDIRMLMEKLIKLMDI